MFKMTFGLKPHCGLNNRKLNQERLDFPDKELYIQTSMEAFPSLCCWEVLTHPEQVMVDYVLILEDSQFYELQPCSEKDMSIF